jgi:uncharacterized protein Veg
MIKLKAIKTLSKKQRGKNIKLKAEGPNKKSLCIQIRNQGLN